MHGTAYSASSTIASNLEEDPLDPLAVSPICQAVTRIHGGENSQAHAHRSTDHRLRLFDGTPEIPGEHIRLAAAWLERIQTVLSADASCPPTQPREQHPRSPMSCFEDRRECIVRDDRNSIMIHRLDYELIKSQAAQGIIGSEFMLGQESFAVFSGPYPFDNPPSLPESADDPAPGKHATEDGQADADTDILCLLSNKVDAQEPRRPAPRDSAHRTSSYAPLPQNASLPTPMHPRAARQEVSRLHCRAQHLPPIYLPDCPGRHTLPLHGSHSTPTRLVGLVPEFRAASLKAQASCPHCPVCPCTKRASAARGTGTPPPLTSLCPLTRCSSPPTCSTRMRQRKEVFALPAYFSCLHFCTPAAPACSVDAPGPTSRLPAP